MMRQTAYCVIGLDPEECSLQGDCRYWDKKLNICRSIRNERKKRKKQETDLNKCKVCSHKKLKQINIELVTKFRSTGTFRNIGKRYGISYASVYRHFCEHIPVELWEHETTRKRLGSENLMELLIEEANEVRKLRQACSEWLRDPDDPSKLTVDPRSDDVTIVYLAFNENGSPVKVRENLSVILQRLNKEQMVPITWTIKHPDPGTKLIAAAKAFADFGHLVGRLKGELKDVIILQDTEKVRALARGLMKLVPKEKLPKARKLIEEAMDVGD